MYPVYKIHKIYWVHLLKMSIDNILGTVYNKTMQNNNETQRVITIEGREIITMKNTARYQRYKDIQPIGVMAFCNTFGIAIFEPDVIDRYEDNCDLIAAWSSEESYHNYHKHKIHYTSAGRGYIRKGSLRIYLDEMMGIA